MTQPNRRVQAIVLILLIAIAAVGVLLLLMGQLAAQNTGPATSRERTEIESIQPAETPQMADPESNSNVEVVATINDEVITSQAWQQATQIDVVMSRLASEPIPTAEETLDRLVNEVIVLDGAGAVPTPTADDIEARISTLTTAWGITDEAVDSALAEVGLERIDLINRVGRLIQVEAALGQLAAQEEDLNTWLLQSRASAEIGLYRSLANSTIPPSSGPPGDPSASLQPISQLQNQASEIQNPEPAPAALPLAADQTPSEAEEAKTAPEQSRTVRNLYVPPPDMPIAPYPQNAAPDFSLPQLNGQLLTLSDLRGKPTVVNFWASWCPPCRRELPALQAAYASYGDKIGFVAVDVKENADTVAAFVKEMGLTFPIVLDQDGTVSNISYQVRGIPTTIFVDATGVVAARHVGPLDEALIDGYLTPLLETPPAIIEQTKASDDGASAATSATITINGTDVSSSVSVDLGQPSVSMPTGERQSTAGDLKDISQPVGPLPMAPDFTLTAANGALISLKDYRDKSAVVLVFYRGST